MPLVSTAGLRGSRLASFRLPQAVWKTAVRTLGVACVLCRFVDQIRYGNSHPWTLLLFGIGLLATTSAAPRHIRFYEKGLSIPKAAGSVFLSREQLLQTKLDGDGFTVTGPDANWGGPYSGGIFRIRHEDSRTFQDALVRFQQTAY